MFGFGKEKSNGLDQATEEAFKILYLGMARQYMQSGIFFDAANSDPYLAGFISFSIEFESTRASTKFHVSKDQIRLVITGVVLKLYGEAAKSVFAYINKLDEEGNADYMKGIQNADKFACFKIGRRKLEDDIEYNQALFHGKALDPEAPDDMAAVIGYQILWFHSQMREFAFTRKH